MLRRNDIRQYEEMIDEWWLPHGRFAMLHWIAAARASLIPYAGRPSAALIDLGCGAGLLAPHISDRGYLHVGVDLVESSLRLARQHDVRPIRGDVRRLPFATACADTVVAGEILEHVTDPAGVIIEAIRVLRPGGTLVVDTINATALARFVAVAVGERVPGIAPKGIHDPELFVSPHLLMNACARHGVILNVRGIRPAAGQLLRWLATRRGAVRMIPTRTPAVLYQAWGVKEA
jgi:2-polyprenyl-6-hydroxyphenyl methylase / 3-demethylubiquinone-9 3-methyltransferase